MLWEQMRPCPPRTMEDFRKDSRYQGVKRMKGILTFIKFHVVCLNERHMVYSVKTFIMNFYLLMKTFDTDLLKILSPDQYAAHPTAPDKPEEGLLLLQR